MRACRLLLRVLTVLATNCCVPLLATNCCVPLLTHCVVGPSYFYVSMECFVTVLQDESDEERAPQEECVALRGSGPLSVNPAPYDLWNSYGMAESSDDDDNQTGAMTQPVDSARGGGAAQRAGLSVQMGAQGLQLLRAEQEATGNTSSSRRPSYSRRAPDGSTKGIRNPWSVDVTSHLVSINTPFAWYQHPNVCSADCPNDRLCTGKTSPQDLRLCATWSFGYDDPHLPAVETAKMRVPNHTAVKRFFQLQRDLRTVDAHGNVTGIGFKLVHGSGIQVCGPHMGRVYGCNPTTWETQSKDIMKGAVEWGGNTDALGTETRRQLNAPDTKLEVCTAWWFEEAEQYEACPNDPHCLLHDACEWTYILSDVFLPFQIEKLGRTQMFGTLAEARADLSIRSTWYAGRKGALLRLAQAHFGQDAKAYRLKARDKHSSMPDCPKCEALRSRRADLVARQAPRALFEELKVDILEHREEYMGERRALERVRLKAGREDTVFWQRDGCGSDVLYLPSRVRRLRTTTDLYQYKLGMQNEMIRGKLMTNNLLPPFLRKGANFGATSLLNFIVDMQDAGYWTEKTTEAAVNWDGGGEQNNYVQHAVCLQLLHEGVVKKKLITMRLPKEHHHEFNDTTFASTEASTKKPGFAGIDTLHGMKDHLVDHFSKPTSAYASYKTKIQFQFGSHNFEKFYDGRVSAAFQCYKDIRVFKYEREEDGTITLQYKENLQVGDVMEGGLLTQSEWGSTNCILNQNFAKTPHPPPHHTTTPCPFTRFVGIQALGR